MPDFSNKSMTATEVTMLNAERNAEGMLKLAAARDRLRSELLQPIISRLAQATSEDDNAGLH